jgi:hypothetical protein
MNSTSLVPLLRTPTSPSPTRRTVYSGLANFRTVIHTINVTHQLKLICCARACPGRCGVRCAAPHNLLAFGLEFPYATSVLVNISQY